MDNTVPVNFPAIIEYGLKNFRGLRDRNPNGPSFLLYWTEQLAKNGLGAIFNGPHK